MVFRNGAHLGLSVNIIGYFLLSMCKLPQQLKVALCKVLNETLFETSSDDRSMAINGSAPSTS